jgi:hypothetical protein
VCSRGVESTTLGVRTLQGTQSRALWVKLDSAEWHAVWAAERRARFYGGSSFSEQTLAECTKSDVECNFKKNIFEIVLFFGKRGF